MSQEDIDKARKKANQFEIGAFSEKSENIAVYPSIETEPLSEAEVKTKFLDPPEKFLQKMRYEANQLKEREVYSSSVQKFMPLPAAQLTSKLAKFSLVGWSTCLVFVLSLFTFIQVALLHHYGAVRGYYGYLLCKYEDPGKCLDCFDHDARREVIPGPVNETELNCAAYRCDSGKSKSTKCKGTCVSPPMALLGYRGVCDEGTGQWAAGVDTAGVDTSEVTSSIAAHSVSYRDEKLRPGLPLCSQEPKERKYLDFISGTDYTSIDKTRWACGAIQAWMSPDNMANELYKDRENTKYASRNRCRPDAGETLNKPGLLLPRYGLWSCLLGPGPHNVKDVPKEYTSRKNINMTADLSDIWNYKPWKCLPGLTRNVNMRKSYSGQDCPENVRELFGKNSEIYGDGTIPPADRFVEIHSHV